jgi:hypothetical protein
MLSNSSELLAAQDDLSLDYVMLIFCPCKLLSAFVQLVLKELERLGALVAQPCRLRKLSLERTELSLGLLLLLIKSTESVVRFLCPPFELLKLASSILMLLPFGC